MVDKSTADYEWRKEVKKYLAADETTKSSTKDMYNGTKTSISAVCKYLDDQWRPVALPCAHATLEPDPQLHWDSCTAHFDKFHNTFLEIADLANCATSVPASDDELVSCSESGSEPFNIFQSEDCSLLETTQGSASIVPPSTLTRTTRANQVAGLEDNDETGLLQNIAPLTVDTNDASARQSATPAVEQDVTSGAEINTPSYIGRPHRRTRRQRKQQRRGTATTDDPPAMPLEQSPWPHRDKISTTTYLRAPCGMRRKANIEERDRRQ